MVAPLKKWCKNTKEKNYVLLEKIEFPDSIKDEALAALDMMNINHLSLFPDLDGAAMHSNYLLDSKNYLTKEAEASWAK